jgi:hypothetical protein
MSEERPVRSDGDADVDLRFAAMVAEHEQGKWTVVREVVEMLARLGAATGDEHSDGSADRKRRP